MSRDRAEIYVSTDIEADGPIPGPHSMLSFGSAAFLEDHTLVGTYTANLETLPDAVPHPDTLAWWDQFPEAWAACRSLPRPPAEVMREYLAWLHELPGRPVFVAWPASWDFMWIYWYLIRFTGQKPFGESALDIRSYAMGMRKREFWKSGKSYLPRRWSTGLRHQHVALDDALEQGTMFCLMLGENREGSS